MTLPPWLTSRATVLVAFAFALSANLGAVVVFVVNHQQQNSFEQCEAQYQQDFALGYHARYVVSRAVSHAMDAIVKSVSDKNPEELTTAVANYQSLRHVQKATQSQHPLPRLPSKVCGAAKDAGQ